MRDRRGHDNQAYLGRTFESDLMDLDTDGDNGHSPVSTPDGGALGAPEPIITEIAQTAASASEGPQLLPASAELHDSTNAAPVAEAPPEDAGYSTAGLDARPPSAASPVLDDGGAMDGPQALNLPATPAGGAPAPSGGGASFVSDDMGWDLAAFMEDGGYDAILMGQMPGMGNCPGNDVFIFVDELNIDITNNTLIQETNISIIADDGGVIDIGGDFTAIQTQESLIADGSVTELPGTGAAAFAPTDAPMIEGEMAMA